MYHYLIFAAATILAAQGASAAIATQATYCTGSTCGVGAHCAVVAGRAVCSCPAGHTGDPLYTCRKLECTQDVDCGGSRVCLDYHCIDPCSSHPCGSGAECRSAGHVPVCSCPSGYTGDPAVACRRADPCSPSPCGVNTRCEPQGETPVCKCLPGYYGSPLSGCRHECESDSACGSHQACVDFHCRNPCDTACGSGATCKVTNHVPLCSCPPGYIGNPFSGCRTECVSNGECPRGRPACVNGRCANPCEGACGVNANCELRGSTAVCSCPKDRTGDPYTFCRPFEKADLCAPNPCGTNARCTPGYDNLQRDRPVCTCPEGYHGDPLINCIRGECSSDDHCADHLACIDYSCVNPCTGRCGSNANCETKRHIAVCTCPSGYNGDALIGCSQGRSLYSRYFRYYRGN